MQKMDFLWNADLLEMNKDIRGIINTGLDKKKMFERNS